MHAYRCLFLDKDDRVGGEMTIHADDLADAVEQAEEMLKERPRCRWIELWEGETLAYSSPLMETL
jgi:hypothetical protein